LNARELETHIKSDMNVKIIEINEKFMNNLPSWKKLERETEIMESVQYKNLMRHRLRFPEHSHPKYTIITHCKTDFVYLSLQNYKYDYYCWIDFGYCKKPEWIPKKLIDINKINKNKVNFTLINPLDQNDSNIMYTLHVAPEKIGGYFFFGNKETVTKYINLYHKNLDEFQKLGIADDDQHLTLRCYYENPDLFQLYVLGNWHLALTHFQLD
jgi:hypothetical protein